MWKEHYIWSLNFSINMGCKTWKTKEVSDRTIGFGILRGLMSQVWGIAWKLLQLLINSALQATKLVSSNSHQNILCWFSCIYFLYLYFQEIGRLALEANQTADGVLVLESGIMSLKHEVKLVGEELQEKAKKIDMDASMAQGVSFQFL